MTTWEIIELDRRAAPKGSLPLAVAAPVGALAAAGGQLTRALAAEWARAFLKDQPHADIAPGLRQLVAKDAVWQEAEASLAAEDWATALPMLERIVEIDPTDLAALFNIASAHRGLGDAARALADLQAVEDGFSDEGLYHANVGRTLEQLDRTDEAIAAYERALELMAGDAFLIDRLVALGRLVRAFDDGGQAIFVDAKVFADSVREDLAQHTEDADYLVSVAQALVEGGHDDLARNAAELALVAEPGRADAQLFAGIALARLGRLDHALTHLDDHVASVPTSSVGHGHRGHVLGALGRQDEARVAGERALALDPNDIGAVQLLVAGEDGAEGALRRAEALVARSPAAWAPLRVAGDLAHVTGDGERAVSLWLEAIANGADDATMALLLGELGRAERFDELCDIADDISRLADRDPGVRWNIANGYAAAGRPDDARLVFRMIVHDERVGVDLRAASEGRIAELDADHV
jgi:tetratricopeptide (TPR) repeat protein